jgi:hypothetical protein
MKLTFLPLLAVLACSSSPAAEMSCAQQMGQQRAALLAQQCRQVSPATHPPCNAANSCAMIIDEIERGCSMPGDESSPRFCYPAERAGAFQGFLFSGGGTDARLVTVLTDKGDRIFAYCTQQCDDLFTEPDDHDVVALREGLAGRRVAIEVAIERNAGRIAGPGDRDRIPLVKRIKLLK